MRHVPNWWQGTGRRGKIKSDGGDKQYTTVSSYSRRGSREYEDPLNKNFLYGELTKRFIHQIEFQAHEQRVLDIGCGTIHL